MFACAILFQTQFSDWCDAVITRAIQLKIGEVETVEVESAEELAHALIVNEGRSLYLRARRPMHWLRDVLIATKSQFIVGLDDPRYAAADFIFRHKIDLPEATRRAARASALIMPCLKLPGAFVVYSSDAWRDPRGTVAAMLEHLGFSITAAELEAIVTGLPTDALEPDDLALTQLTEHEQDIINDALVPFAEVFGGAELDQIIWHRELFFEENHGPPSGPLTLKGNIRYMIYGPYIVLPPGRWMAEMVLGFSQDALHMSFKLEVSAGRNLTFVQVQPQSNIITINVTFELESTNENFVEIRLLNERAAAQGSIALGQTTLTRIQKSVPPVVEKIKAELGLDEARPTWSF